MMLSKFKKIGLCFFMVFSLLLLGQNLFKKYIFLHDLGKKEDYLKEIIKKQSREKNKKREMLTFSSPEEIIQLFFFSLKKYGFNIQLFEPKKSLKNNKTVSIKMQWKTTVLQWKRWWEFITRQGYPINIDSLFVTFDENGMLFVRIRLTIRCVQQSQVNPSLLSDSIQAMHFVSYIKAKKKSSGWIVLPNGRLVEVEVGSIVGIQEAKVLSINENKMIIAVENKKIEMKIGR